MSARVQDCVDALESNYWKELVVNACVQPLRRCLPWAALSRRVNGVCIWKALHCQPHVAQWPGFWVFLAT